MLQTDDRAQAREFGAALAARRRRRGLTQAQVAEIMGVEKETVSRMENGVISPTLLRLRQMAGILGCPLSDLFRDPSSDAEAQADAIADLLQELPREERVLVMNVVAELVRVFKLRPHGGA
jgi:transcriptional regulator with XRE-family HTH domain